MTARRFGCAALVALFLLSATRAASAAAQGRVLVVPFENATRNSRIIWLSEAAAVLLADDLNALGVTAITREERREAFERLQVPPAAVLTDATVIRIGQLVGASTVVLGSVELDDETLVVRARTIALETGRIDATPVERGELQAMFGVFERVARAIAPPSAKSTAEVESGHPPLGAFEDYIKGVLADSPTTAVNYLNGALKLHPGFDRARLALWDVYTDQGEHQQAAAAVDAVPAASPFGRRAKFRSGLSRIQLKKYDEAFAIFKQLVDEQPTAPALNNLGIVQLRRGATPQTGPATYFFTKASEADPDDPDYFFNLGYAYWLDRDTQAAIYWLREALRRNAADGDAHFVLGAALAAAGSTSESSREKELARRLSSRYEQWDRRPAPESVPRGLERVKSSVELPHARRVDTTLASSEQRDQRELARFYLDRGRRLFRQERDGEALTELNRALYFSPYDAEGNLLVGRIHLRAGRVREATDAFKVSLWSHETAEAHVALGEAYLAGKDSSAARAEADRALALDPASAAAKALLTKIAASDRGGGHG